MESQSYELSPCRQFIHLCVKMQKDIIGSGSKCNVHCTGDNYCSEVNEELQDLRWKTNDIQVVCIMYTLIKAFLQYFLTNTFCFFKNAAVKKNFEECIVMNILLNILCKILS